MKKIQLICSLLFLLFQAIPSSAQEKLGSQDSTITYITGTINNKIKPDSVVLMLHGPFVGIDGASEKDAAKLIFAKVKKEGTFQFMFKTDLSPFHITLYQSNNRNESGSLQDITVVNNYLVEPGDSIDVNLNSQIPAFIGRGTDLFEAQAKIRAVDQGGKKLMRDSNDYFRKNPRRWLYEKDSLLSAQLNLLASFKLQLSDLAYAIIRADIIGVNRAWLYRRLSFAGPFFVAGTPMDNSLDDLYQEIKKRPAYVDPEDRSAITPEYIHYLYEKTRIEVRYERIKNNENPFLNADYFNSINLQYDGVLRDKLLAYWLYSISINNQMAQEYITKALSVMQSPVYIQYVKNLESTFYGNEPILDYNFQDVNGKTVNISDYRGKAILIDLWFTGCAPCLAVAKGLRLVEKEFENRSDVVFLSICTDKDKNMWLKSIDKTKMAESYSYYIAAATKYLYTSGTGQKNPFIKKYVPNEGYPFLLIIDKKGKIYSSTPARPITEDGRKILVNEITMASKRGK
ncbi:TlpA family protein disulfide reductase [Mucilaginibacter aquariorum]|uniref:TlpA family protein disulfide reductase n=1 Tax=Mucilaginibacter aquariorum TaxID=2967225 RepID=A0ABT1T105_9SPHI|nr:TlpA disulfide reductase family protein [Mucilaginibacter aquariorum]MCQ6958278.1 TlpA family protein disulfide reductase [Mucilaginibacter aquariorum]